MSRQRDWDEFFLTVLYAADFFINPSMRKLNDSFESWEYRLGCQRSLRRLEKAQLIIVDEQRDQMLHRLTDEGRTAITNGNPFLIAWDLPWDGKWRMVLFDLPSHDKLLRLRLWRWLRANRFGHLQYSVWIRPDSVSHVDAILDEFRDKVDSLTIMESTCADNQNSAIVQAAWDCKAINRRYNEYLQNFSLTVRDVARLRGSKSRQRNWLRAERRAWQAAVGLDPFLPRALWPSDYAGERAWNQRLHSFAALIQ